MMRLVESCLFCLGLGRVLAYYSSSIHVVSFSMVVVIFVLGMPGPNFSRNLITQHSRQP